MDYGILYYRSDTILEPPKTYAQLTSMFLEDTYNTDKDFNKDKYVTQLTGK